MLRLRVPVRFANGRASLCMTIRCGLHAKLYYCGAGAAFVLWGLGDRLYVGELLQELAEGFAEDAHAAAVDYADGGQAGQEGTIDEALDFAGGVVDGAADYVYFAGDVGGVVVAVQRDGDAAGARGFYRRVSGCGLGGGQDCGNV